MTLQARRLRRAALAVALIIGAGVLALRLRSLAGGVGRLPALGGQDLVAYWSAARLLQEGRDPYDPVALLAEQQAAGWRKPDPQ